MSEEQEKRTGPRRWSDEQIYRQFEKAQDRLFEITHELSDKYLRAEQTMGDIREEISKLEVKIGNRFIALFMLLIAALIAFGLDLAKGWLIAHGGK